MPSPNQKNLDRRKLIAQGRGCCDALRSVFADVFVDSRPADRALRAFFHRNHRYGSRDRRLISNSIFPVFRWWGWLRNVVDADRAFVAPGILAASSEATQGADEQAAVLSDAECYKLLLGAAMLEREGLGTIAEVYAQEAGIPWRAVCRLAQNKDLALSDLGERVVALLCGGDAGRGRVTVDLPALIPDWAVSYIECPLELEELIGWLQQRPPIWIRVHQETPAEVQAGLREEKITANAHPAMARALRVNQTPVNLYGLDLFRKGAFEIQDLASQATSLICAPETGQRWWDACAGAGGKTLHLAALMGGKGTVVATDIREYKLDDLKRRARRSGISNITARPWDGKKLRRKQASFDGVLVDAPCTCSGTWRRNPDARWQTLPEDVDELAALQLRLLANAASGLRPGGTLVYATCSMFMQENDGVVQQFLTENPGFELEPFVNPLNGSMTAGTLQIWPWDGNCDAMFVSRFRQTGVAP